jgi:tellurite resistance protein TerC
MVEIAHTGTPLLYGGFSLLVVGLLLVDFFLLRVQGSHKVSVREAAIWSVVWFAVALAFGGWLWWYLGGLHGPAVANQKTLEYLTGYLIEKGLAIENVFVWITIFGYFAVPPEYQKRVLLWGVVGAILMRAVLIYLGALMIEQFSWIFYVFGAFTNKKSDLSKNPLLRWLRNHMRITDELHGERFWIIRDGVRYATPLFLVLILVEVSDLIFAVDSIPAIFAVTADPFIVFTANTFAILGLRAMYFLLADMADRFHLLGYGLATIIAFVGVKMLIKDIYKMPVLVMLGMVAVILAVSIVASLVTKPAEKAEPA